MLLVVIWVVIVSVVIFVLVIQIYETCYYSENTVALHVMQLERQLLSSDHLVGCLKLHVFVAALMFLLIYCICIISFDACFICTHSLFLCCFCEIIYFIYCFLGSIFSTV